VTDHTEGPEGDPAALPGTSQPLWAPSVERARGGAIPLGSESGAAAPGASTSAVVPFSSTWFGTAGGPGASPPGAAPPRPPSPEPSPGGQRGPNWLVVAVVAALIGGAVGAIVTAVADRGGGGQATTLTIKESSAAPGAAELSGNVPIPALVHAVLPAVVSVDVRAATAEDEGTGMIITADGMVVTNNHVIALANGGGTINVVQSGTTKALKATLVGTDPNNDVALLKVAGVSGLPTVTFGNSKRAQVGDAVVAIGNALGLSRGTPTVTQGIVSALGRTVTAGGTTSGTTETLQGLIQTDAAINPGNSGGPLVDTSGQVIGMNTAVAGTTSDGESSQNIGFAIPSARIEALLTELERGGVHPKGPGYLGVSVTDVTPTLQQNYGLTPSSGVLIVSTEPGGPADQAGLVGGDVIVGLGGTRITTQDDLHAALAKDYPGEVVQVTFYDGNLEQTASVTLAASPSGG